MSVRILIGDCRERMRELADSGVDSVVCDPPYHLTSIVKRFGAKNAAAAKVGKTGAYARASKGFMGQTWDGGDVAFRPETWAEALRVLKPGGHLAAFSGTRTYHRMASAIEAAGFEVRDMLSWNFGSGFPKSHNITKALAASGLACACPRTVADERGSQAWGGWPVCPGCSKPIIPEGYGTALKPAHEPICLARKPLDGTVANCVLKHGTGAINIDGCRIEAGEGDYDHPGNERVCPVGGENSAWRTNSGFTNTRQKPPHSLGRWAANIIHDGSDEVLAGFPDVSTGDVRPYVSASDGFLQGCKGQRTGSHSGDSGSAARFFYCAKATTEERGEGNNHPTVKPVALMRWLVRLITPPGGTVLDPFMGSGSTGIAADAEQFNFVGCELSPEYAEIARNRITAAAGLFADISVETTKFKAEAA